VPTRSARAKHGWTCAPLNREKRAVAKRSNMLKGAGTGGMIGYVFGPLGTIGGMLFGV